MVLMQEINQAFVLHAQNANTTSALIVTFIFMRAYTTAQVVRASGIPGQLVLLKNDKLLMQKPRNCFSLFQIVVSYLLDLHIKFTKAHNVDLRFEQLSPVQHTHKLFLHPNLECWYGFDQHNT